MGVTLAGAADSTGPGRPLSLRLKFLLGISALTLVLVAGTVLIAGRVQMGVLTREASSKAEAMARLLAGQLRNESPDGIDNAVLDAITDASAVPGISYVASIDTSYAVDLFNRVDGPYQEVLERPEVSEAWRSGRSIDVDLVTSDGESVIAWLTPFMSFGVPRGGGLLIIYDRENINRQVRGLQRTILLLGLGALAAGILLSLVLARRFSAPVERLKEAAVRIGGGDFGRTVPVETRDEIGTLAETFNTMSIELKKREEEVRRAERLSAIGTTASVIAHEMKTPLQSVMTYTEMLKFKFDDQGFRDRYTDVVMPQITRLGSLVDDLLDYSRETRLSPTDVDLNIQLRQAVHFFGDVLLNSDVTARESYGAERSVTADPDRLDQVFFNLVRNAIEAQPNGGVLGVVTRSAGDEAVVLVADAGDGIPGDEQKSIFEPFFTTKSKGTGLGLAISSKLVVAHGGTIEVYSPLGGLPADDRAVLEEVLASQWPGPDRGTCFRVAFPHPSEEV